MTYPLVQKASLTATIGREVDAWHQVDEGTEEAISGQLVLRTELIVLGEGFKQCSGHFITSSTVEIANGDNLIADGRSYDVVKVDRLYNALTGKVEQKVVYLE